MIMHINRYFLCLISLLIRKYLYFPTQDSWIIANEIIGKIEWQEITFRWEPKDILGYEKNNPTKNAYFWFKQI